MNINTPESVDFILNTLNQNNYQAYIVGGAVRDSLLNRKIKDWDIATDATPDKIQLLFNKTLPTGLKHGTVTVIVGKEQHEVTTFRVDGDYSDGRHPDRVVFTDDLMEDMSRRDFTINGMGYNKQMGLVDPFGGLYDIEHKIIRCVGNPNDRFTEDALRMMRAIRFDCQLDFSIESSTLSAIAKNSGLIQKVSAERIQDELNKILVTDRVNKGIYILYSSRLLDYILPELTDCFGVSQNTPYHFTDVGRHTLFTLFNIAPILNLRLTMLLHDIGKASTKTIAENGVEHFYGHQQVSYDKSIEIMKRLRYDNGTIDTVSTLILHHMDEIIPSKRVVRRFLNRLGIDLFLNLLEVKIADYYGQSPEFYKSRHREIMEVGKILDEILNEKEAFSLKDLAVNGDDLIENGFQEGKELGIVLAGLMELVIDDPELNKREILLRRAKEML